MTSFRLKVSISKGYSSIGKIMTCDLRFRPTIEILFMKILDFFNIWVFVRTSTNFAHLARFQAIEFEERPVPKTLDILYVRQAKTKLSLQNAAICNCCSLLCHCVSLQRKRLSSNKQENN